MLDWDNSEDPGPAFRVGEALEQESLKRKSKRSQVESRDIGAGTQLRDEIGK